MRIKILVAAMGAAAMLAQPAVAETDFDDRWHIGAAAGFARPDTSRQADDSWHGGINFGRFLTPQWSLDFRIDRY